MAAVPIFDGSNPLELDAFAEWFMLFCKNSYAGPLGTLLSFFEVALIRQVYAGLGLAYPDWQIPPEAPSDPDIPTVESTFTVQPAMLLYNATVSRNAKAKQAHEAYKAAELICADIVKAHLGPNPKMQIKLATNLGSTYKVIFDTLFKFYKKVGAEPLEALLDKLLGPIDTSLPFAAFVGNSQLTHRTFLQRTGETIPDKVKMWAMGKATKQIPYLQEGRAKFIEDNPEYKDQSFEGLVDKVSEYAARYEETNPPAPQSLFGGAATTTGVQMKQYKRDNGKSWTKQQICEFATLPYFKWKLFCFTCGTGCPHDSATHKVAKDGPKDAAHDDNVKQAGGAGKQTPFEAHVFHEALKLKAKYNIA